MSKSLDYPAIGTPDHQHTCLAEYEKSSDVDDNDDSVDDFTSALFLSEFAISVCFFCVLQRSAFSNPSSQRSALLPSP